MNNNALQRKHVIDNNMKCDTCREQKFNLMLKRGWISVNRNDPYSYTWCAKGHWYRKKPAQEKCKDYTPI